MKEENLIYFVGWFWFKSKRFIMADIYKSPIKCEYLLWKVLFHYIHIQFSKLLELSTRYFPFSLEQCSNSRHNQINAQIKATDEIFIANWNGIPFRLHFHDKMWKICMSCYHICSILHADSFSSIKIKPIQNKQAYFTSTIRLLITPFDFIQYMLFAFAIQ